MPAIQAPATDQNAPSDLIGFFKANPDEQLRRGERYPQWFLVRLAVLGILRAAVAPVILSISPAGSPISTATAQELEHKRWLADATFLHLIDKTHLQD
jgi:hypothetical protein